MHVDRVPKHDHVHREAERSEPVFAVAQTQLPTLSVKGYASQLLAAVAAVELDQDAAAVSLFVDEPQQVERLD